MCGVSVFECGVSVFECGVSVFECGVSVVRMFMSDVQMLSALSSFYSLSRSKILWTQKDTEDIKSQLVALKQISTDFEEICR